MLDVFSKGPISSHSLAAAAAAAVNGFAPLSQNRSTLDFVG